LHDLPQVLSTEMNRRVLLLLQAHDPIPTSSSADTHTTVVARDMNFADDLVAGHSEWTRSVQLLIAPRRTTLLRNLFRHSALLSASSSYLQ